MKQFLLKVKPIKYLVKGKSFINDLYFKDAQQKTQIELSKKPSRTEILNFLLSRIDGKRTYLEIGVRNPDDNYNHIEAESKYSVDPGVEFESNPVDFKMTSDDFFRKLATGEILNKEIKFDVIFIDGLHLAEQAEKDIINSLNYIKDDGFIVLHDCNPPTEWHARESYEYSNSPALGYWNGTTWKAFVKFRFESQLNSCCIDTDWGVGILSKQNKIGKATSPINPYFEYSIFDTNRATLLNLINFEQLKKML